MKSEEPTYALLVASWADKQDLYRRCIIFNSCMTLMMSHKINHNSPSEGYDMHRPTALLWVLLKNFVAVTSDNRSSKSLAP